MRCKAIAKVVVVNDAGETLVLRRSPDDTDRPGGWDFPGGGVTPNEDLVAAVRREASEEAGIALQNPRLVWGMTEGYTSDTYIVWLIYLAHVTGRPVITLSHEHDHYEWFKPEAFLKANPYKKHHDLFAYLRAHHLLDREPAQGTVTARAFIFNAQGELLLLRRSQTDTFYAGAWDLPGGRAETGEDPLQTVVRETKEEAGIQLQAPRLACAISNDTRIGPWLFYVARMSDTMSPVLGSEHDAYKWIPLADIPRHTDYQVLLRAHALVAQFNP